MSVRSSSRLGRVRQAPKGPGFFLVFRPIRPDRAHLAPSGGTRGSPAGRDHPRQRHHQSERRGDPLCASIPMLRPSRWRTTSTRRRSWPRPPFAPSRRGRTGRALEPPRQVEPPHPVHHGSAHRALRREGRLRRSEAG